MLILFNLTLCKKQEIMSEDEDPFYSDLEEGCYSTQIDRNIKEKSQCITKKEDMLCFNILQNSKFSRIDQVLKNTKWTSPNFQEATLNYYINKLGTITVLEGGPLRKRVEYEKIGKGRIYKKNESWIYEQFCEYDKCEKLNFAIEYINCNVRYYRDDNEHRLFLTIGNRFYDHYDDTEKRKFLSIVLEDPVKPQIENGFELYLVPPPPK
ncbi:hypothetical protein [Leptospira vanthielii]|uniref:Uncharacterized protein n=1 Tax=Leptospira vanthielii serovar Holland str. Waz Holland = ATCC 700522 TaxID=1218591 RepID=N1VZS4_9LEPT|nr:hypothetical protein [Leptospira vanthielii]EMY68283.1 hypothetical protein LEP1GSC199_0896 [Leptospira vanthielii serovar Holland str. Waz Holland = ATCC 700522]